MIYLSIGINRKGNPMQTSQYVVRTREELQAILGEPFVTQTNKCIDHIDQHCRTWIERCPFIIISSVSAAGAMDVSPKGDPPGFVQVLDAHTLAIPDRPGNRRADTFVNILEHPKVAIIFLIPRRGETLRVSGRAHISRDPALLERMAVRGKVPELAICVEVEEAMFHCGKALIRSQLWQPEAWQSIDGLPTYAQALVDHAHLSDSEEEVQKRVTHNERERLY
jgi:PPOX class probable FMN-dependent enzyme